MRAVLSRCAAIAFLLPCSALALEYNVNLFLEQVYSDNIALLPSDVAVSDWVTRIQPGIDVIYTGQSLTLDGAYQYETLLYRDNEVADQDYHNLDGIARYYLIADELQLYGQATFTQINVDPTRPPANSNITITGNRTDGWVWQVGPEWRREVPFNSEIDAYYHFGRIDFDDPGSQSVSSDRLGIRLSSIADSGYATAYDLNYEYWRLDYEIAGPITDQQISFTLSQELREGFSLTGLVGLDSDFRDPREESLTEPRWEAGFDARNADSYLTGAVGSRFWGTIFRISAGKTLRDWYYTVTYAEEPGTTESIYLGQLSVDATASNPRLPPDARVDTPGTGERFIMRRADLTIEWTGSRSDFDGRWYWDERDYLPLSATQGGAGGAPAVTTGDSKAVGFDLDYNWKMGARTTTGLNGSWSRRYFDDLVNNIEDDVDYFWAGVDVGYQLGVNTSVGATLGYNKSSGSLSFSNYDEFRASIYLNWALSPEFSQNTRSFRSRNVR